MSKYDELERLLAEATPGPWYALDAKADYSKPLAERDGPYEDFSYGNTWAFGTEPNTTMWITDNGCGGYGISEADARLVAAMRNALPDLLAERRELRARLLEELALRVGTSDVIDPSLAAGWNDAREGRWAERRAVCLLRHYADGIRTGRIK